MVKTIEVEYEVGSGGSGLRMTDIYEGGHLWASVKGDFVEVYDSEHAVTVQLGIYFRPIRVRNMTNIGAMPDGE